MTDEALLIRVDAGRRLREWDERTLQGPRYALVVVGYCRLRFGDDWNNFHTTGRRGDRLLLLSNAERVAGRLYPGAPHLAELQALAERLLTRANQSLDIERNALERGDAIPGHVVVELLAETDQHELDAIRLLARSLYQPEAAARELLDTDGVDLATALNVMECVRPEGWESASGWFATDLPRDAYTWARGATDTQDYSSLPILADLLEDAGCPDRGLLNHCRSNCAHVRGCAALDRLCGYQT